MKSIENPKVRVTTCGQGAKMAMKSTKSRLTVKFDFDMMHAICDNAEAFHNRLGILCIRIVTY